MNQTWENKKKLNLESILVCLAQIWVHKLFWRFHLYYFLDIVPTYRPMQFKEKLMNQTWENKKKPNFGSNFGLFGPNLGPLNFFGWFYLY